MNRHSRFHDHCGGELPVGNEWPKTCPRCKRGVWPNPTPIGVILLPVHDPISNKIGFLSGKRVNNPKAGEWGLPGGFINDTEEGETILQGAVRELWEETGQDFRHMLDQFLYHFEYPNPPQSQVLVFFKMKWAVPINRIEVGPCSFSNECDELRIEWEPVELCFTSHTEALRLAFERLPAEFRA